MTEQNPNLKHFVCTGGCGGVTSEPKTCGMETCPKHGQPLTECHCTDGRHFEAFQVDGEELSE